ncbi:MAG: carbamoyltransferase HypF [Gemmatimonadota bacterium]|nr:carbamoyltransferase HypF [Gemmatimonadota bacterium]
MAERRLIEVEGVVQGVGFRPYVHRLAASNALRGFVRNDGGGVHIDVEGEAEHVDEFCRLLTLAPPPLATIAALRVAAAVPRAYDSFVITPSEPSTETRTPGIPPDVTTCDACVRELFDPANRRFRHPFITCTECGPRFTIVEGTPFDRERTTMAEFLLCATCRHEYENPHDRRFHSESICCPDCGPTLVARNVSVDDALHAGQDALDVVIAALRSGRIVAIKSLGGFHLACDATDHATVERLRQRKRRPTKPFAVMVRDAAEATSLCELSAAEHDVLTSSARPVVVLRTRSDGRIAPSAAPGVGTLGLMLPSTPLHHLLLSAIDRPLVMTSGNIGGDPVAIDESSALADLGGIADLFLTHDRPIAARCDASVAHVVAGAPRPLRRARGYVPHPIRLPADVPAPVLAVGGHLKNTICVASGRTAHLSAHVGDLDSAAARAAIHGAIEGTLRIAGVRPTVIAHDLHPDYASTRIAETFAATQGITRRVPVQHHHAHVAACLAELRVREPVIGVVFDGAGLGTDGATWGGEFLVVDGARFARHGHLAYVPLPGGDAAARRPWRSAAAHLAHAGREQVAAFRPASIGKDEWLLVQQLVTRGELTPRTSSVGRLFDAVASLLGLCHVASFEGEAAMALEAAAEARVADAYPVVLSGDASWTADAASIIDGVVTDLARGRSRPEIAAAFHGALRDLVVLGCERVREQTGLHTAVLSGGVFANVLLAETAHDALVAGGFRVLIPREVPCNDGGLSLGQAYVAVCALEEESCA